MIRRSVMILVAILSAMLAMSPIVHASTTQAVDADLGFEEAFPRRFYEKKYFGVAVTGASIVSAGVFSYVTAGAGAPAAATGVSTVASWVAGGGAGSYMAGLSTIGGWFGGNAMLGAAILNGISLGTVGGVSSFAALSTGQKALVMSSIAATTLDGVALVGNGHTQDLDFHVTLPVPRALADKRLGQLVDALEKVNKKLATTEVDLEKEADRSSKSGNSEPPLPTPKVLKLERELAAEGAKRKELDRQIEAEVDRAVSREETNGNSVVLAVLAHNLGKVDKFRRLLDRIDVTSDYLSYLRAVKAVQQDDYAEAKRLLIESSKQAPYAIEPPVLLVNLLGAEDFVKNEDAITGIAMRADEDFDSDAYASRANLVSLHYRIGTLALRAQRCNKALEEFKKAHDNLSNDSEERWRKGYSHLLKIGTANAHHCDGNMKEAEEAFASARKKRER